MDEIATGVSVQDIAIFNGTLYVGDVFGGKVLVMNTNGTLIDDNQYWLWTSIHGSET